MARDEIIAVCRGEKLKSKIVNDHDNEEDSNAAQEKIPKGGPSDSQVKSKSPVIKTRGFTIFFSK